MSAITQADSTVVAIKKKVRRLTASASTSALSDADLDLAINTFYSQDFPYAIKTDQMRSIYTFFTQPNIDRYPLDVYYNQSVRGPVYVEGIEGVLFKDRKNFFNLWPRFPTKFQQGGTSLSGIITGATQANPAVITSPDHNLTTGAVVTISGIVGMTQLNGNNYTITVIDANDFSLNGIDSTGFGAYISGGTWTAISQTFSFIIPGPFLSREVVIGGVDQNGNPISINDNGFGILNYLTPNPVFFVPDANPTTNPAIPGMYNLNTEDPGLNNPLNIGTVNYVSGQINFTLPSGISLGAGQLFTVWVSQYQTGRPYSILFWNNEFTIRPVPKLIHKVEVETYLTPVQFLASTDNPIVQQWWQMISYGVSREILRERQDMEGVANLEEGYLRQEALVLERQACEEINIPNYNIFNSPQQQFCNGGWSQGAWG
jgi:hypothetical protein